jgi:nucleoside-diphosphate-sugar epimerase
MPKILARKESRVSPFVRLVQKSVDFEDGNPPQIYHFVAQAPYVHVLARTPSGRIPLVRQLRPCPEANTLEFPGGTVDDGQDPATAARMDVEEETGHRVLNHFGRRLIDRVLIFWPHNVYGPDMGREHVIPQFALRMRDLAPRQPDGVIDFPIQGSGGETRSFIQVNDLASAVLVALDKGEHPGQGYQGRFIIPPLSAVIA